MQDLRNKLNEIIQILEDSKKLMNDSYRMLMADSSEKFSLINRNKFLTRVRDSFWKLAVIELTKLYGSRNDCFRLDMLIDQMILNYENAEWSTNISKADLETLQTTLNNNEILIRKEKLKEIRDQHYAHKDQNPDHNIHDIKFYYIDLDELIRAAELIISELMLKIFGLSSSFNTYDGEDVDNFLNTHLKK